jgi:hypothetical protein
MKNKRPRVPAKIMYGKVEYSTNPIQQSCCRSLFIQHVYNSLNFKRISRIVKKT